MRLTMKRLEVNDSNAYNMMGVHHIQGTMGLKKDVRKGLEYLEKAATELGLATANHALGFIYLDGIGVEKDEAKAMHHLRLAAIGGNLQSRHSLGIIAFYGKPQRAELAMKHWILAAEAGNDASLENVKVGYQKGCVTKDVYTKTLRAHKSAADELQSDQRDKAMEYYQVNVSERASQKGILERK